MQMIVNEKFPQYKEAKDIEIIYQNIFGFSFINSYIEDPSFEEMNGKDPLKFAGLLKNLHMETDRMAMERYCWV